jgi:hypothetical protein
LVISGLKTLKDNPSAMSSEPRFAWGSALPTLAAPRVSLRPLRDAAYYGLLRREWTGRA